MEISIEHGRAALLNHVTGRDAFVFDLMEPERGLAERRVLEMLRNHEFAKADFVVTSKGTCRLCPHVAQAVFQ